MKFFVSILLLTCATLPLYAQGSTEAYRLIGKPVIVEIPPTRADIVIDRPPPKFRERDVTADYPPVTYRAVPRFQERNAPATYTVPAPAPYVERMAPQQTGRGPCPGDCQCGCHEGQDCPCVKTIAPQRAAPRRAGAGPQGPCPGDCQCGCHEGQDCPCVKRVRMQHGAPPPGARAVPLHPQLVLPRGAPPGMRPPVNAPAPYRAPTPYAPGYRQAPMPYVPLMPYAPPPGGGSYRPAAPAGPSRSPC